ncbi:sigma-70 family RNA polymerase sigma factor [Halobacillus litoralis]|uniref:Sigma-70 family RNA polymerase sigma factor n=1 Tax=Halobacillus litoralis TaxID=45668 RepID=A0A845FBD7_9BACI|nr:sigma-70 family RNA polymerase sigma factor [Halobacillus litoralis]MYL71732.1 sigma-70 family RNA polymerase sigma factor [Halobacillus litoralis]
MGYTNKQKSGPVYSNISLIKKSLVQSPNGKLPYHDIVLSLKKTWIRSSGDDINFFVNLALNAKKSYFQEDENGLWAIKNRENRELNEVIRYVSEIARPFKVKEVISFFPGEVSLNELDNYLKTDIRFTELEGSPYWLLSEWSLVNDLVYDYMQKQKTVSQKIDEVIKEVIIEYKLDTNTTIFAPHIDERFNTVKNLVSVELYEFINEFDENIIVPKEISEEIARASVKLMNWVGSQESEFKIKDCIPDVFRIKASENSFALYYQAIEDFFTIVSTVSKVKKGTYVFTGNVSDTRLNKYGFTNSIYGSVPFIKNIEDLYKSSEEKNEEWKLDKRQPPKSIEQKRSYGYTTLSYYERIKGYLNVPSSLSGHFNSEAVFDKLSIQVEGFIYEGWWVFKDDRYTIYGDGINDFYSDYLLKPGHSLKVESNGKETLNISIIGFDERYSEEQSRYLDIGKIAEESKAVNKSIFTLMCEVLATYPSGMHWTQLLDQVMEIRSTTRKTVYNLLSKNECFEKVTSKKGYWKLNIVKLSRFYVDEEGNDAELIIEQIKPPAKTEKIFNPRENKQSYIDPYVFDEEYELPPLHISFSNWAKKQEGINFSDAVNKTTGKEDLIGILTESYAKLLCNFAKSRQLYSVEFMDLVQEGFFAIMKAVENFNGENSFSNYLKIWLRQRISRQRADMANLIRLPVHMIEQIDKLDRLIDRSLTLYGRSPELQEVLEAGLSQNAVNTLPLYTIDYVSFEQFWGYVSNKNELFYTNPWFAGAIINNKISRHNYKVTDKQLQEVLSKLCEIDEQDNEECWATTNVEKEIESKVLSEEVTNILEALSTREKQVIRFRYGLDNSEEKTLQEIGDILGITRERVRQIEKKSLERILVLAKKQKLNEFIS